MCGLSTAGTAASTHGAWCCRTLSCQLGSSSAGAACTRLPAELWGWRGPGGGCVPGPFCLPVLFPSHAALGSPGRGGGVSRLPSSKKRSCFPWCCWVLWPGCSLQRWWRSWAPGALGHRFFSPIPQPSSQLWGVCQPAVYHLMAGLGAGRWFALLFIFLTSVMLGTSHLMGSEVPVRG